MLILGIVVMMAVLAIIGQICGRSHLGAAQSASHYLDEVEAMAHTPYISSSYRISGVLPWQSYGCFSALWG